uniref:Uncharacterized protein n=1 Tax=Romanomermis culicivorax TaxID=13658 RepID=A0A915INJ2_ROMCU
RTFAEGHTTIIRPSFPLHNQSEGRTFKGPNFAVKVEFSLHSDPQSAKPATAIYQGVLQNGMEQNRMQSTQPNRTKGKFSISSIRLKVTISRFPQNFSYLFRPKAERFKLLTISSIEKSNINDP